MILNNFSVLTHLVVASFDHEKGRLVFFYAHIESRERTAMFLGGVEQDRLIHRDPHGQPGPQCK